MEMVPSNSLYIQMWGRVCSCFANKGAASQSQITHARDWLLRSRGQPISERISRRLLGLLSHLPYNKPKNKKIMRVIYISMRIFTYFKVMESILFCFYYVALNGLPLIIKSMPPVSILMKISHYLREASSSAIRR